MNARGHCRMREREEDFCMREENIFKNLNIHFSYLHDWFFRKKIIGGNSFSQAAPFNRC